MRYMCQLLKLISLSPCRQLKLVKYHYNSTLGGSNMSIPDNDVLAKIKKLYTQKGWSVYRLAKESDIPYSSLNNMMLRNTQPSVPTLRKICNGLGITMSEFFDDDIPVSNFQYLLHLDSEEYTMIESFRKLDDFDKRLLNAYLAGLSKKLPEM